MNYQNLYCWLVINRLNNPLPKEESTEEHHVLPECLCGPLESEDRILREFLVPLSPKEHYIAHRLLLKIYPKESKERKSMFYAFNYMCHSPSNNPITNKSINVKGDKITDLLQKGYIFGRGPNFKVANNIKKYNKERIITDKIRKKFSDLRTGRVWIHNPITKQRKFVKGKVLEECLNSKIYVLGTGKIKMDHK